MKISFPFLFLAFIFNSCSDSPNLNKEQVLEMLREGDPNLEVMVPLSISQPLVNCGEYLPPCQVGYKVKIKNMEVTGLFYEDQKRAYKSAKSMRGYHLRNWAFDQVAGEPILERFFENEMGAKKVE